VGKFNACRKFELYERFLAASIRHPRPSVPLFLGFCVLSALMTIGFLIIKASDDDAASRHGFDTSVDHSKR
jgi:hypothetical protein